MNGNGRGTRLRVVAGRESLISSGGGSLLARTAEVSGLDRALSQALAPWRAARARHDPGKIVLDLAVGIALGGDCLADLPVVRCQPDLFGAVASDPTVSRLVATLAEDAPGSTGGAARGPRAGSRTGVGARSAGARTTAPVVIDMDATLVAAHSEKEGATADLEAHLRVSPAAGLRSTTARVAPENRSAPCCAPGGRARTTPPTTSPCSTQALAQLPPAGTVAGAGPRRRRRRGARLRPPRPRPRNCTTRWASTSTSPSWTPSRRFPARPGGPRSTPTAPRARERRSPS